MLVFCFIDEGIPAKSVLGTGLFLGRAAGAQRQGCPGCTSLGLPLISLALCPGGALLRCSWEVPWLRSSGHMPFQRSQRQPRARSPTFDTGTEQLQESQDGLSAPVSHPLPPAAGDEPPADVRRDRTQQNIETGCSPAVVQNEGNEVTRCAVFPEPCAQGTAQLFLQRAGGVGPETAGVGDQPFLDGSRGQRFSLA